MEIRAVGVVLSGPVAAIASDCAKPQKCRGFTAVPSKCPAAGRTRGSHNGLTARSLPRRDLNFGANLVHN